MKKSWGLIPKIISGQKTIESRWYKTRRVPWNKIKAGDTVFFKNSGEKVIVKAKVEKVLEFEIATIDNAKEIIKRYGRKICLVENDPKKWNGMPKYCVLIFLLSPHVLKNPFLINKKGFGMSSAWITVKNIKEIIY